MRQYHSTDILEQKERLRDYLRRNNGRLKMLYTCTNYDLRNILKEIRVREWSVMGMTAMTSHLIRLGYPLILLPEPKSYTDGMPLNVLSATCSMDLSLLDDQKIKC